MTRHSLSKVLSQMSNAFRRLRLLAVALVAIAAMSSMARETKADDAEMTKARKCCLQRTCEGGCCCCRPAGKASPVSHATPSVRVPTALVERSSSCECFWDDSGSRIPVSSHDLRTAQHQKVDQSRSKLVDLSFASRSAEPFGRFFALNPSRPATRLFLQHARLLI